MVVVDNSETFFQNAIQGLRLLYKLNILDRIRYNFRIANIVNRTTADRQSIYTLCCCRKALYNEGCVNKLSWEPHRNCVQSIERVFVSRC